MFENIGEKLKLLAKILCGVGIVGSIVVAIIMFVKAGDVPYSQEGMFRALGFVFLIIGPPVSWISSCALYGFGELIDTNSEIARNTRQYDTHFSNNRETNISFSAPSTSNSNEEIKHKWRGRCDKCHQNDVLVTSVKIVDAAGTRYMNVCDQCIGKTERTETLDS